MRRTLVVLGIVVLALAGIMFGAGALSPSTEVVVLTANDASGTGHETSVWIVEDQEALWLRSGSPESRWLARVRLDPRVQLTRGDEARPYRAVIVDEAGQRERINELMDEKYGVSNSLVSLFADHDVSVPIRLEPATAVGAGPPD